MRILSWAFRILLFLVFFGFAILNTDRVTVDLFLGAWHAPLALVLLVFFAAGALLGVAVLVPALIRQRQELRRMTRIAPPAAVSPPPAVEPPRI